MLHLFAQVFCEFLKARFLFNIILYHFKFIFQQKNRHSLFSVLYVSSFLSSFLWDRSVSASHFKLSLRSPCPNIIPTILQIAMLLGSTIYICTQHCQFDICVSCRITIANETYLYFQNKYYKLFRFAITDKNHIKTALHHFFVTLN